jgi:acyl-CoA synthetase (AMP-forming)/AMP-acid ligase II
MTGTTTWTFPDVWEQVAAALPDAPAAIHGDRRIAWAEFDRRAAALAATLLAHGLEAGAKVAQYMPNRPEYMESFYGALKVSLVPVNTNYRYLDDELTYLWDNSDAEAVVFDGQYTGVVERVRHRVPGVRAWLHVGAAGECPGWAVPYEDAVAGPDTVAPGRARSDDDLILLYTGGTTGRPKGVMWRQADMLSLLNSLERRGLPERSGPEELAAFFAGRRPGKRSLIACPLMHGTGLFFALGTLNLGGAVATLPIPRFSGHALLDALVGVPADAVVIVGDAFARPLLDTLDADPARWSLDHVRVVMSSGAIWSEPVKRRLTARFPNALLIDGLGSSETGSIASSNTAGDSVAETATFKPSANSAVILDDGRFAAPGSGDIGHLAVTGWIPLGYYNDPDKTAEVFKVVGGRRWSIPGDLATLEADGSIRLLGRGSNCINTAGEKVFPEEVEEALKTHPAVADAAVVGVPHERYGQVIVALVEPTGAARPHPEELIVHVKSRLAGYKAPKLISVVDSVERAPNGKLDYPHLRRRAIEAWAVEE